MDRYPHAEEQRAQQFMFGIEDGKHPSSGIKDLGIQGVFFKSKDEKNIAQFRVDGFTFNRLRPYTSWDEIFPEAISLWREYARLTVPQMITRLAVRYINRIPTPPPGVSIETYFRSVPSVPTALPQTISGFLTRVTIRDMSGDLYANVMQVLDIAAANLPPTVILDIDAFVQREFTIDSHEIEHALIQLREFKNRIFFNMLTQDALRLFE
jgi:uncharacterized protein (TIGR04255 family)